MRSCIEQSAKNRRPREAAKAVAAGVKAALAEDARAGRADGTAVPERVPVARAVPAALRRRRVHSRRAVTAKGRHRKARPGNAPLKAAGAKEDSGANGGPRPSTVSTH